MKGVFIRGETEEISKHEQQVLDELRQINERLDRLDAKVAETPETQ